MQGYIMPLVKNSIAVGVVDMINPSQFVPNNTPLGSSLQGGVSVAIAEEIIDYIDKGKSNITQGNYNNFVDNVAFNTATMYGISATGTGDMISDTVSKLPVNKQVGEAIGGGIIVSIAKTLADYIDKNVSLRNSPLKYIVHPTKTLKF